MSTIFNIKPIDNVIGKTITGISTSNYDGYSAEGLVLNFSDGTALVISNEWDDLSGWNHFNIEFDDHQ